MRVHVDEAGRDHQSRRVDHLARRSEVAPHGGDPPANKPRIDPDQPDVTWLALATFKLSNNTLYINPCSTDPTQSALACNVNATTPCGTLMPPGTGLPANVVADIDTWLKCGAPKN